MSLNKDLEELIQAGLITTEKGKAIRAYYQQKAERKPGRLFAVFGILGAILIGLGIILIIAHNWDNLSRGIKTVLALLPLIVAQVLCGYTILKKSENTTWKESTATLLFFGVGASIAMVSQVYNIPGDLSAFLFTWLLLTIPLVYLMPSSMVSLLCIIGSSYYASSVGHGYQGTPPYFYWLFLLSLMPHYYFLYKNKPGGNFITLHNWMLPLSIIICLGTMSFGHEDWMWVAYCSLFGLFYLIGSLDYFKSVNMGRNGFLLLGAVGTIILLLILSYDWFWSDLREENYVFSEFIVSPELWVSVLLTLLAGYFLYRYQTNSSRRFFSPLAVVFILFIGIFIIGFNSVVAPILINLVVFVIGVLTIRNGLNEEHFGILNYGLLTVVALISCRFLDADLGFLFRGLLFVFVGIGFIATNYWMLKKRKTHA